MIYLKLFEDHNDDLYEQISQEEWNKSVGYDDETGVKFESFIKKEVILITDTLVEMGYYYENIFDDDIFDDDKSIKDGVNVLNLLSEGGLSITKISDEWFFIFDRLEFNFYKCDDIEGLLKCLREKFTNI